MKTITVKKARVNSRIESKGSYCGYFYPSRWVSKKEQPNYTPDMLNQES